MKETMIETDVTYTLAHDGKFFLFEHVPARVCRETGEQYFAHGDRAAYPVCSQREKT
uniref:YgiT-type zinc finger domain-containing protein n=1 Tax=Candidatus Kentrum sp. FW TaxID=2126338 RepID=A0A450TLG7_9GAMM|nr:MAG: YgiT-type zinc finger domain-containing protein [Candidatus Kentron sp. FW]